MDVNAYLAKQYDNPPCWQLVADVYTAELALPVTAYKTVNASIRAIASAFRIALHKTPDGFVQVSEPIDYCIVLMGKTAATGLHHCGVFYQGSVLHGLITGNRFEEMSVIRDAYAVIEFWARSA
jgi:hypothetical protein